MRFALPVTISALLIACAISGFAWLTQPKPATAYRGLVSPTPAAEWPAYDRDYGIPPIELMLAIVKGVRAEEERAVELALHIYSSKSTNAYAISKGFRDRILGGLQLSYFSSSHAKQQIDRACNNAHGALDSACWKVRAGHGEPTICVFPVPDPKIIIYRAELVNWAHEQLKRQTPQIPKLDIPVVTSIGSISL